MKKRLLTLMGIVLMVSSINAQNRDFESILFAAEDAGKLMEAYVNPAMVGLIYSMNGGWYHTAKSHKLFGFDITIGASASVVPSEQEIFQFANLGLSSNTVPSAPEAATVMGPSDLQVPVTFNGTIQGQSVSATFNMPGGITDDLPVNAVPAPNIQVGVGLPWKIDAIIRYSPEVGSDDVRGRLTGIGIKKEITSWFGPMDKTPLHVALLAAYTHMSVDYDIQNESTIPGVNQRAEFELNSYNFEAIASLNFPFINVYGSLGYSSGTSTLGVLGTYELEYDTGQPAPNDTVTETVVDPLDVDFDAGAFKATVGARISLGFFKIFGSYTLQEFNTINAGIALSFR